MSAKFELIGWENNPGCNEALFFMAVVFLITAFRVFYSGTRACQKFPESAAMITIGLLVGLFVELLPDDTVFKNFMTISPDVYMCIIIPLIILDASYFMNQTAFFNNFGEILVYAIIGTTMNTFMIALLLICSKPIFLHNYRSSQLLAFSSLISSTDPVSVLAVMEQLQVNENLFNLAFGESTLNDGVAICLFDTFEGFDSLIDGDYTTWQIIGLILAKFVISIVIALIVAFVLLLLYAQMTKYSFKLPNTEILIMFMYPLLCYTLSNALECSGIISVMTAALLMTRYITYNCDEKSTKAFSNTAHMISQTVEAFLFFSMGNQIMFTLFDDQLKIDTNFVVLTILYCIIARFVAVIIQTFFINQRRKKLCLKISFQEQIILTWCGLRGGIAFSLAKSYEDELGDEYFVDGKMFVLTVSILVVFTIFVFGLSMRLMIVGMHIQREKENTLQFKILDKGIAIAKQCIQLIVGDSIEGKEFLFNIDQGIQRMTLKHRLPQERDIIEMADYLKNKKIDDMGRKRELSELSDSSLSYHVKRPARKHVMKQRVEDSEVGLLVGNSDTI